jgi:4-amino-4-deoxy-L-arabinose transferase-like glycosyltransferase
VLAGPTAAHPGDARAGAESLVRPPGYPWFLSVATLGQPERLAAARLATAAAGALCPVLVAALSVRLFRHRTLALVTGGLAVIQPRPVVLSIEIRPEALLTILLLVAGYLLLAAADRPSSNLAVLAGVALALAALTSWSALALAAFLFSPVFDRRHPRRVGVHVAMSALLGFGAVLAPWAIVNASAFRGFAHGISTGGAFSGASRDPTPPAAAVWLTVLGLLAVLGLVRAPRRGAALFCAILLAATLLAHVIVRAGWGARAATWDPILLLYGVFGAGTLAAFSRREPA